MIFKLLRERKEELHLSECIPGPSYTSVLHPVFHLLSYALAINYPIAPAVAKAAMESGVAQAFCQARYVCHLRVDDISVHVAIIA